MPKSSRDNNLSTMEGNPDMQPRNARPSGEPKPSEGGEPSSAGINSSISSETQPESEKSSSPNQSSPVPTTESPSELGQVESGTAYTADGVTSEEEPKPRRRRGGF